MPGSSGFVRALLEGWDLSGIVSAQTGPWLNLTETSNYQSSRPDYVGGNAVTPNLQQSRIYLNRAAFALVPTPNRNPIRPGNLGRAAISGPGSWNIKPTVAKTTKLREGLALQIRVDAFNLLNHANPGGITTNLSSASFGTINSITTRTMQLGARLAF